PPPQVPQACIQSDPVGAAHAPPPGPGGGVATGTSPVRRSVAPGPVGSRSCAPRPIRRDAAAGSSPRYNEIASKRCAGGETQLWTCCALPAGGARRLCSTAPAPEVQTPDYLAALGTLEAVVASTRTSTLRGQNLAGPWRHLHPRVAHGRQGFPAADCPVRHRELGATRPNPASPGCLGVLRDPLGAAYRPSAFVSSQDAGQSA